MTSLSNEYESAPVEISEGTYAQCIEPKKRASFSHDNGGGASESYAAKLFSNMENRKREKESESEREREMCPRFSATTEAERSKNRIAKRSEFRWPISMHEVAERLRCNKYKIGGTWKMRKHS